MKRFLLKKLINAILLLPVFILLTGAGEVEFPKFTVHLVKGVATLKKPAAKVVAIKQKDLVFSEDLIEIKKDNTEIHLIDKDGNFVVLTKKGKYKAGDIKNAEIRKNTGIIKKYFHLLWEDSFHPEPSDRVSVKNIGGASGGVERGDDDCQLIVLPVNGEATSADTIRFAWHAGKTNTYSFVLLNEEGVEAMNLVLHDTSLIALAPGWRTGARTSYYVSVREAGVNCSTSSKSRFYLVDKEQEKKEIAALLKQVNNDDPLLYNLQVADILEKNGFFQEAKNYIAKAINQ